ncbi:MAG: hypothetical protein JXA03_16905 [Bacteroidales bacterium]|nr:hypothetical protein [Bacteroidales bacterium]
MKKLILVILTIIFFSLFKGYGWNTPGMASPTVVARQPAFLMAGGEVRAADGFSLPQFNFTVNQNLFVVVEHRNHIQVMSAQPAPLFENVYSRDFRTGAGQNYGGELGCVEVSPGQWGLTGGDGNGDSQVNNTDKNDIWIPNTGSGGQTPD